MTSEATPTRRTAVMADHTRCARCDGRGVLTRSGRDSVTGEDADEDWPCDCHPEQYGRSDHG